MELSPLGDVSVVRQPDGLPGQVSAPAEAEVREARRGRGLDLVTVYDGTPIPEVEDRAEAIELCSSDPLFFCHYCFPRAFRQADPPYAPRFWSVLLNPDHRYVAIEVFRGGAKTTNLRAYLAMRIAFGLSRTILYIGKSDDDARRSLLWLRKQITFNDRFTTLFGLGKGTKFNEGVLEVEHGIEGESVFVTGTGITGSIRGINFDDYRPDLIVLDDIINAESVGTEYVRKKISELVHGDVKESLEAATDNPHAKLAYIGTPLAADDPGQQAKVDPEWGNFRFSCWTPETESLPVEEQVSSWPARYPTEALRSQKRAAIATNRLWIFAREKECRLTSPESATFKAEWLRFYETLPPMHELRDRTMWIDPVPKPTAKQVEQGLAKKDFESFGVVARHRDRFYVLEIRSNKGHEPDWTVKTFFELMRKWRVQQCWVESVAYQSTLAWILQQAMKERREYYTVMESEGDNRSKLDKITDSLHGPASNGVVYVQPSMATFIDQYSNFPDVSHDDELECVARAIGKLNAKGINEALDEEEMFLDDGNVVELTAWRSCP